MLVQHQGSTNIRQHCRKCSRPGELAPRICAHLS